MVQLMTLLPSPTLLTHAAFMCLDLPNHLARCAAWPPSSHCRFRCITGTTSTTIQGKGTHQSCNPTTYEVGMLQQIKRLHIALIPDIHPCHLNFAALFLANLLIMSVQNSS